MVSSGIYFPARTFMPNYRGTFEGEIRISGHFREGWDHCSRAVEWARGMLQYQSIAVGLPRHCTHTVEWIWWMFSTNTSIFGGDHKNVAEWTSLKFSYLTISQCSPQKHCSRAVWWIWAMFSSHTSIFGSATKTLQLCSSITHFLEVFVPHHQLLVGHNSIAAMPYNELEGLFKFHTNIRGFTPKTLQPRSWMNFLEVLVPLHQLLVGHTSMAAMPYKDFDRSFLSIQISLGWPPKHCSHAVYWTSGRFCFTHAFGGRPRKRCSRAVGCISLTISNITIRCFCFRTSSIGHAAVLFCVCFYFLSSENCSMCACLL